MKMETKTAEQIQKIIEYYFLTMLVFGAVGIFLFLSDNITLVRTLPYIQYLFGDARMFDVSVVLPIFIVAITALTYYGMKKNEGYARLLAIPILAIAAFSFPLGTALSVIFIAFLVSPYGKYEPMPRGNLIYRGVGASLIIFSVLGMLSVTGGLAAIQSNIIPMSVSPEAKIMSEETLTGQVQVIIDLNFETGTMAAVQAQDVFIQDVETMGGVVADQMSTLDNSILTTIDANKLMELAANPQVRAIIPNQDVFFVPLSTDDTEQPVYLLDVSYKTLNVQPLWDQGITGKGVVVAVVDTGINSKLPCFQRDGKSIVIDSLQLYGEHVMWHGTAVASCIASQDPVYKGVAPGVSLLNVEVFKATGGADIWSIKKGWDWVAQYKLTHQSTPVICCNSLGANPYQSPAAIVLNDYAGQLVTKYNIPMIVAAGNGYPTDPITLHINCPGESDKVLTVGAVDNTGASGSLAYFSCRGLTKQGAKKPDVVAPGVDIRMFDNNGAKKTASGTSFATPLTAGVVALIAEKHPDYSAYQLEQSVIKGADTKVLPRGAKYDTNYGYGLVDALAGLAASDSETAVGKTAQSYNYMLFLVFPFIGAIVFFVPEIKKRKF